MNHISFPPYQEHRPLLGHQIPRNRCWQKYHQSQAVIYCSFSIIAVGVSLIAYSVIGLIIGQKDCSKSDDPQFKDEMEEKEIGQVIAGVVGLALASGSALCLRRHCQEDFSDDGDDQIP